MYQRILVPIDGSDTAQRGLEEAIALASRLGASLRLFHVVDPMAVYIGMSSLASLPVGVLELREDGERLLKGGLALAVQAGVKADTHLEECPAPNVGKLIIDTAQHWPADLIVMGTHGRKGVRHVVLGSDAEDVVRRSPVPVLLVRATA
ncbi:universal stress protein [Neisseriaceae bacterium JH1-16]|nr:universal stress protein [Neisseriaceae bacterium JH1-16]